MSNSGKPLASGDVRDSRLSRIDGSYIELDEQDRGRA